MINTFPDNIKSLHLEFTDKCQASCPMCARNQFGGPESPHIKNVELSLNQIKTWLPPSFLKQIEHIFICGSNGDPLMATECLEILEYFRDHTSDTCGIEVFTNGGLRNKDWWVRLASALQHRAILMFAVDGWAGEHELYRRGVRWEKVIDNIKTYIGAGGRVRVETLVFKHNEARIEELKKYLLSLGVESVWLRATNRFWGFKQFPVKNRKSEFEYYLEPATDPTWVNALPTPNYARLVDKTEYDNMIASAKIEPLCGAGYKIFINSQGYVYPCSWVGNLVDDAKYVEIQTNDEQILRNQIEQSAIDIVNDIDRVKLQDISLPDALKQSKWNTELPKHWSTSPKLICVKSCATNLNDIIK